MGKFDKIVKGVAAAASLTGVAASLLTKNETKDIEEKEETDEKTESVLTGKKIKIANDTFDIGEIKDWYLENIDYVFTPIYKEEEYEAGLFKSKTIRIVPTGEYKEFAASIDDKNNSINMNGIKTKNFVESIAKEVIQKASDSLSEYLNNKDSDSDDLLSNLKTFRLIDKDGRRTLLHVKDFPCYLINLDGSIEKTTIKDMDLRLGNKNVERPIVKSVPTLVVEADKNYYYFGNGINFKDISELFNNLTTEINRMKKEIECSKLNTGEADIESKIKKVNDLYKQGLIPEEEYRKQISELLAKL